MELVFIDRSSMTAHICEFISGITNEVKHNGTEQMSCWQVANKHDISGFYIWPTSYSKLDNETKFYKHNIILNSGGKCDIHQQTKPSI